MTSMDAIHPTAIPPAAVPPAKPPKTITARQAAARRANGKKGRGPKTAEGKARSRLNALRHGFYSRIQPAHDCLVDREEFEALVRELTQDFAPTMQIELALVERVAHDLFRMRRLAAMENARLCEPPRTYSPFTDPRPMRSRDSDVKGRTLEDFDGPLAVLAEAHRRCSAPPPEAWTPVADPERAAELLWYDMCWLKRRTQVMQENLANLKENFKTPAPSDGAPADPPTPSPEPPDPDEVARVNARLAEAAADVEAARQDEATLGDQALGFRSDKDVAKALASPAALDEKQRQGLITLSARAIEEYADKRKRLLEMWEWEKSEDLKQLGPRVEAELPNLLKLATYEDHLRRNLEKNLAQLRLLKKDR